MILKFTTNLFHIIKKTLKQIKSNRHRHGNGNGNGNCNGNGNGNGNDNGEVTAR